MSRKKRKKEKETVKKYGEVKKIWQISGDFRRICCQIFLCSC